MTYRAALCAMTAVLLAARAMSQTAGPRECTILAVGDVNLGRQVGQRIIAGDTLYPFRHLREMLSRAELVIANLESPLTDQGGETRHPSDGYRFCGPRSAAWSLRQGGVDVVTGANNHAYDYGRRGLLETLTSLAEADIPVAGLNSGPTSGSVVVEAGGIRVGIVAYTEFVNIPGKWGGNIALFDLSRARAEIRSLRGKADIVIASYHGGTEYTERPPAGTLRNLRALADAGADIVVGHHPHVPQGIERHNGKIILYSLGNCVFYQPQEYWARFGIAAGIHLVDRGGRPQIDGVRILPFRAGLQPAPDLSDGELDSLQARFNASSPTPLRRVGSTFIVEMYDHSFF